MVFIPKRINEGSVKEISTVEAKKSIAFSVLNREKKEKIHEASLYLLAKVGMKVQGEKMLRLLREHGCGTGVEGRIFFPHQVVEKALRSAPRQLVLFTRGGEPYITVDSREQQYFGTHADQLELLDPATGKARKFVSDDTRMMCLLADYLPNIHFILSVGMSSDVPPDIQSQITFLETVMNFRKPINFSTNDVNALYDIIEIAATVAGGKKQLQEKPFIFNYCEPIPPLAHPETSTEKLRISAENRVPVVYMPYCMMGGTSVMSLAGTLAQCNAEVLAGLVMTQIVSEGTPFIYGAMPSVFDMKTTIGSYGAPEFHLLVAAASEMASFYGLPFYGTAGCSDAKTLDEQAVAEITMELFSTILSKANLVHDVGVMDHCNSVSPEAVVLADEIIAALKSYADGVEVNDENLALEVIEKVGPGGHFLNEKHTRNNFRKIWYPDLFSRAMENEDVSAVRTKIRDKIQHIVTWHQVPELEEGLARELAGWMNRLKKVR